jgi:hypothetical protein
MSDLESVSSSSSEEEIVIAPPVEVKKRKGRGKNKPETVETLLKEEIIDTKPIRGRGKKTIAKKMEESKNETLEPPAPPPEKKKRAKKVKAEPAEEIEEIPKHMGGDVEPVKKEKKKRVLTEEQREKQLAALAKGRATRIENAKKKKAEREQFVEDLKVKIADPVVKETIIKEVAPAPVSVQRNGNKRSASVPAVAPPVQGRQALRFV